MWISVVTKDNSIRNGYVRSSIGVVSLQKKMREDNLSRLGHFLRRKVAEAVKVVKTCI